jgi:hypothetical protein
VAALDPSIHSTPTMTPPIRSDAPAGRRVAHSTEGSPRHTRSALHLAVIAALEAPGALIPGACTRLAPAPGLELGRVTVVTNPERVCYDDRTTPYLNFDLVVRNGTEDEVEISEIRAIVTDTAGKLRERRVVGQQALELLGDGRTVRSMGDGLLYNPLLFNAARPGSRVRYELRFAGEAVAPVSVTFTPASCASQARLVLPLVGQVAVYDGHDHLSHHRRTNYLLDAWRSAGAVDNPSRYALDLVSVDADGRAFRGDGRRNEDWLSWGRPVRAAGAGTVVATYNDQPDNTVIGSENLWRPRPWTEDPMTDAGNFVLIDHGNGEFSLTSHLRAGSVRVRRGDRVRSGDLIGEVGNSGSARGPHLHYELRSGWGVRDVRGLPAHFHDVRVLGTGEGDDGRPVMVNTGDVLLAR